MEFMGCPSYHLSPSSNSIHCRSCRTMFNLEKYVEVNLSNSKLCFQGHLPMEVYIRGGVSWKWACTVTEAEKSHTLRSVSKRTCQASGKTQIEP